MPKSLPSNAKKSSAAAAKAKQSSKPKSKSKSSHGNGNGGPAARGAKASTHPVPSVPTQRKDKRGREAPLLPTQPPAKKTAITLDVSSPDGAGNDDGVGSVVLSDPQTLHGSADGENNVSVPASKASGQSEVESWNAMLYQLLLYKSQRGDFNVCHSDPSYKALYDWVQLQRRLYRVYTEGGASIVGATSDNEGGDSDDDDDDDGVEGGVDVNGPAYQDEGENNMDKKISSKKSRRKSGMLCADRIAVLNTLDFPWMIRGDSNWHKQFESLIRYKSEHGDVKVPRLYSKNPRLGEWVTDQRRQWKLRCEGKHSMLSDERKRKLDEVGFVWKMRDRADWNDRYEQLLEYKKDVGDCKVPQHYPKNKALGKWVAKQREQYRFYREGRHSFLTEERIDLLKSIGFVWKMKGRGPRNTAADAVSDAKVAVAKKEEEENEDVKVEDKEEVKEEEAKTHRSLKVPLISSPVLEEKEEEGKQEEEEDDDDEEEEPQEEEHEEVEEEEEEEEEEEVEPEEEEEEEEQEAIQAKETENGKSDDGEQEEEGTESSDDEQPPSSHSAPPSPGLDMMPPALDMMPPHSKRAERATTYPGGATLINNALAVGGSLANNNANTVGAALLNNNNNNINLFGTALAHHNAQSVSAAMASNNANFVDAIGNNNTNHAGSFANNMLNPQHQPSIYDNARMLGETFVGAPSMDAATIFELERRLSSSENHPHQRPMPAPIAMDRMAAMDRIAANSMLHRDRNSFAMGDNMGSVSVSAMSAATMRHPHHQHHPQPQHHHLFQQERQHLQQRAATAASMAAMAAHHHNGQMPQARAAAANNHLQRGSSGGFEHDGGSRNSDNPANSQTMADIASALASVPRFGDSFTGDEGDPGQGQAQGGPVQGGAKVSALGNVFLNDNGDGRRYSSLL